LRRALIPWLAGIDPDTKAPRRRVARLSEIPAEAGPLIELLVEQHLLSTDLAEDIHEKTIEPAHEALLRQWGLLQGWLEEDAEFLVWLDGVKRAAREWEARGKDLSWLAHSGERLRSAEQLLARPYIAASLEPTDKEYLRAAQQEERAQRRRARRGKIVVVGLAANVVAVTGLAYAGMLSPTYLEGLYNGVPNRIADASLKPGDVKRDCSSQACPEMVALPPGDFMMGSPETENDRSKDEGPQRKVTIAKPFLVSKYEVTFAEWDACYKAGGCSFQANDVGWGRGNRPVINVSWNDIQQYIKWLSIKTGMPYRLLTEAEWEYAARAGTTTRYSWGDEVGDNKANCDGCKSQWDKKQTAPVGSFKANAFRLHDMHGNVWEWVEDCYSEYEWAPDDGSAEPGTSSCPRVLRGGAWEYNPTSVRAAVRYALTPDIRGEHFGFRVARVLSPTWRSLALSCAWVAQCDLLGGAADGDRAGDGRGGEGSHGAPSRRRGPIR
jgi:formylglycine-generating enzyme required for sulfatase activity